MDRQDIRDLRQWHRDAALRSKKAGFDIVYVYATHDLSIAHQFLQRRKNDRTDEYGGPIENRARFLMFKLRTMFADAEQQNGAGPPEHHRVRRIVQERGVTVHAFRSTGFRGRA